MDRGTDSYDGWEPVIGLEIHAQLLTRTKAFCGCETGFGLPPNTRTCPVCLGLPGALPVLNAEALRLALTAALALRCTVNERSLFARKNYFYPDLPKGYQISQYEEPLAVRGRLRIDADRGAREVGITRVHMEEDAGKNVHGRGGRSMVDLNRAGTPLIEIVGDPDLRSPAEARDAMRRLHETLVFAGVTDGNLEQGNFRCDANVSLRRAGSEAFGTRVELKNINSFRFVADAIEVEIRRQRRLLERGEPVRQQTRGYNSDKRESYLLRDKEGEEGYRYFPDPDLPPLWVEAALVSRVRAELPELPDEKRARYVAKLGVGEYNAGVLTGHPRVAELFEQAVALGGAPARVANFIAAELLGDVTTRGLEADLPLSAAQLAELCALVEEGSISGKQQKQLYALVKGTERAPRQVVRDEGMAVIADEAALEAMARAIVAAHPEQAAAYRAGKAGLLGFFVGRMMKESGGSADPKLANQLLRRLLDEGDGAAEG